MDNLKLGYGGTKTEMERLIKDAAAMTDVQKELGITVDASSMSFDNIVNAIHVMQTSMGIAGTTSAEAAGTIEGSVGSMKAAWDNLLVSLASGNKNYQDQLNALVSGVETAFKNVWPIALNFLTGFADLMGKVGPIIVEKLPDMITTVLPALLNAAVSIVGSLVDALPGILSAVVTVASSLVDTISEELNKRWPVIGAAFDGLVSLIGDGFNAIAGFWETTLKPALSAFWSYVTETLAPAVYSAWTTTIGPAITGVFNKIATFWTETLQPALSAFWEFVTTTLAPAIQEAWVNTIQPAIVGTFEAISNFWTSTLQPVFSSIWGWLSDTLGPAFDLVAGAINGDKDAMSKLNDILNIALPIIGGLAAAILAYNIVVKAMEGVSLAAAIAQKAMAAAQLVLNAIMSANPIALVVAALAGLAAAFAIAWNRSEKFREVVTGAWEAVKTGAIELKNKIVSAWETVKSKTSEIWDAVTSWIADAWATIKTNVQDAIMSVRTTMANTWNAIKTTVETVWDSVSKWIFDTWTTIKTNVQNAIMSVRTTMGNIWNSIKSTVEKVWDGIKTWISDAVTAAKDAVQEKLDLMRVKAYEVFNAIKGFMDTYLRPVFNWLTTTFAPVFATVKSAIDALGSWLSDVFAGDWSSAWNSIVSGFGTIWSKLSGYLSAPINAVIDMINGLISAVESAINSIVGGINRALSIRIPAKTFNVFGQEFGFPGWSWSPNLSGVSWGRIGHVGGGSSAGAWGGSGKRFAEGGMLAEGWGYVGEFGPEILRMHNGVASITPADSNPYEGLEAAIERAVSDKLDIIIQKISERMQVVLDTGALVGGIGEEMNAELERIAAWNGGGRA